MRHLSVHAIQERTWRKTLTPNNGSSCLGTDPNGNWDYKWGGECDVTYISHKYRYKSHTTLWSGDPSHLDPCHQIYIGPEPFSEPCVRNMRDAILAVSNRTRMYIDIHSSGQKWLTPYFAGPPNPPDSDELVSNFLSGGMSLFSYLMCSLITNHW